MKKVGWDYEVLNGWHLHDPDFSTHTTEIPDDLYNRLLEAWREMHTVQGLIDEVERGSADENQ